MPLPEQAEPLITDIDAPVSDVSAPSWLDTGDQIFSDVNATLSQLSWDLRESDWIQAPLATWKQDDPEPLAFTVTHDATVYLAHHPQAETASGWLSTWEATQWSLSTTLDPETEFPIRRHRVATGDRVVLGPDAGPSVVMVQRRFPAPPAQTIHHFEVAGSRSPESWRPVGNLRAGQSLYGDGGPAIDRFQSRLSDSDWIRGAHADADNEDLRVRFQVEDHTEVHIALDQRVKELPDWMSDWIDSRAWTLHATESEQPGFRLWKKRFLPGETVDLGPNPGLPGGRAANMYLAIVQSVRAAFTLQTEDQANAAGLVRQDLNAYTGEGYVDLGEHQDTPFAFEIEVGVGDRYGLNFRYHSRAKERIPAHFRIVNTADGTHVCEGEIHFDPVDGEIWSIARTRTCDSINAGTYHVVIEAPELQQLAFDSLEVE